MAGAGILALRDQACNAAERCADQDRRFLESVGDAQDILGESFYGVVSVGSPIAFTMSAQVEGQGMVTALSEALAARLPGVTSLTATMRQQDGAPPFRTEGIRSDVKIPADGK